MYDFDKTQMWNNSFKGVVKMIFSVKERTLRYIKNNIDHFIAFRNIDTSLKYRMAVVIVTEQHESATLTLSDFNIRYSSS